MATVESSEGPTSTANPSKVTAGNESIDSTSIDHWGRSEDFRKALRSAFDPIYRYWFRVEWEGLDKIPKQGPALLVANHSGALPPDALSIMQGIEQGIGRPVYGLADNLFRTIPALNIAWSRGGGVSANPDNAYRLLADEGQLVLAFPEGIRGPLKPFSERYTLRRFGRGGFVETAMRAGVPIIPIAVVGAEESMPVIARVPIPKSQIGIPYLPITLNHVLFGPVLGSVLWFPAKIRIRVLEPVVIDAEPGEARYSRSKVLEESTKIEELIKRAITDMLRRRKNVILG